MIRKLLVVTACLIGCSAAFAKEASTAATVCDGFDPAGLVEGKPLIRVEPSVGTELREDEIDSCLVLAYGLKEKRGTDGAALLVHKPRVVAQSDDATKKEIKAAQRAMSKWLFLTKTHDASKEPIYYSVIIY